jgi:hypothetical protein
VGVLHDRMRHLRLSPPDGSSSPVAIHDIWYETINVYKRETSVARWRRFWVSVKPSSSAPLCDFLGQKAWNQRIFIKKCFAFTVRSACHVTLFPIGCRSFLKGGHVPADGDCHRGECATGWKITPSRQKGNYRHYCHSYWLFTWHGLPHNAWQVRFSQSLCTMGAAHTHPSRYHDEGHDVLARIVTGDESWVHH